MGKEEITRQILCRMRGASLVRQLYQYQEGEKTPKYAFAMCMESMEEVWTGSHM